MAEDPAMWAYLTHVFDFVFADLRAHITAEISKLGSDLREEIKTIKSNQEKLMSTADEIISGLGDVQANLAETKEDMQRVLGISTNQTAKIESLEALVAGLQVQVGELSKLDEIKAKVAEIKAESRTIADISNPAVENPPALPDEPGTGEPADPAPPTGGTPE